MKTGLEVRDRALQLLNYTDADGRIDSAAYGDVMARSLAVVNQIYAELAYCRRTGVHELGSLSEPIDLPERVIDTVLLYGVAMLFAQTIGDADNQALFADWYDQKRATLTYTACRKDVMPRAL